MRSLIEEEQNPDKILSLKWVSADPNDRKRLVEALNIQKELERFIIENDHPCLMAKAVLDSGRYLFGMYNELGTQESASQIHKDLHQFLDLNKESSPQQFSSFVAVFRSPGELSERGFENNLWQQLQYLHEKDAPLYPWDSTVSSDPGDPHFSFSLLGNAFFLIGPRKQLQIGKAVSIPGFGFQFT